MSSEVTLIPPKWRASADSSCSLVAAGPVHDGDALLCFDTSEKAYRLFDLARGVFDASFSVRVPPPMPLPGQVQLHGIRVLQGLNDLATLQIWCERLRPPNNPVRAAIYNLQGALLQKFELPPGLAIATALPGGNAESELRLLLVPTSMLAQKCAVSPDGTQLLASAAAGVYAQAVLRAVRGEDPETAIGLEPQPIDSPVQTIDVRAPPISDTNRSGHYAWSRCSRFLVSFADSKWHVDVALGLLRNRRGRCLPRASGDRASGSQCALRCVCVGAHRCRADEAHSVRRLRRARQKHQACCVSERFQPPGRLRREVGCSHIHGRPSFAHLHRAVRLVELVSDSHEFHIRTVR